MADFKETKIPHLWEKYSTVISTLSQIELHSLTCGGKETISQISNSYQRTIFLNEILDKFMNSKMVNQFW